ncbi:hypothetical protein HDC94_000563 [Leifsonia sp. AK011]|uniref:hypothetical protein n=1 Tax=Leifsonia sp. AK011 TaxID=2723075 RepID=UPI0015CDA1E4|nr:hypothetical protein [Leifsonia sp. AK011]NYF09407.1 hypothetical protein [Leifsonia sp. AK011]
MTFPHKLLDHEAAQDRSDSRRAIVVSVVALVVLVVACVLAAVAGIPTPGVTQ